MKYLKQNAGCISSVLDGHEGHTPKSCCPLYVVHSLSRGNLKNLMPTVDPSLLCASFTAAVPSTIITKRCVLRSTFAKPCIPTVWP